MALAELQLKKLSELIRELKAGRDALMREGQVESAQRISRKVAELERAYMALMREVQTQAELRRITSEAKMARDTYLRPTQDMSMNVSDTARPVGIPMQIGGSPPVGSAPIAQQRARKKKRRKKARR